MAEKAKYVSDKEAAKFRKLDRAIWTQVCVKNGTSIVYLRAIINRERPMNGTKATNLITDLRKHLA